MSLLTDLQAQLETIQSKIAIVERIPEDTFNLGTVIVLAYGPQGVNKLYYVKTAEESWKYMSGNSVKSLAEWIYENTQQPIGYFEVYTLSPAETPIFASA